MYDVIIIRLQILVIINITRLTANKHITLTVFMGLLHYRGIYRGVRIDSFCSCLTASCTIYHYYSLLHYSRNVKSLHTTFCNFIIPSLYDYVDIFNRLVRWLFFVKSHWILIVFAIDPFKWSIIYVTIIEIFVENYFRI